MKRALVLSGGGSRGSYQVGVLLALYSIGMIPEGFQYISGTSVGAINALGLAHYKPENIDMAVRWLYELWTEHIKGTKSIWKKRFPPFISGLYKQSIGQTRPLKRLLEGVVDEVAIAESGIEIRMPAVDIETGDLKIFTQEDNPIDAAMASSSFPGAFPPYKYQGINYTDGGVRDIAPLKGAIQWGAEEVYVILTRDPNRIYGKKEYKSVLGLMSAVIDIMTMEVMLNDIRRCLDVNEKVRNGEVEGYREIDLKVFYPSMILDNSLDFSQDLIKRQILYGVKDVMEWNTLSIGD